MCEQDQGASASPTALSSFGSSPVPGLAADALQSTGADVTWTLVRARVAAASVYTGPGTEAMNEAILAGRKDSIGLVRAALAALCA